jgi:opacity protein-like surface antigen
LLEPYAAVGPVYMGYITEDDTYTDEESFGFNVRGGVDLNILDWLSVGVEANYFVDDLEDFFDNTDYYFSEDGLKNSGLIGVTAKFKF